MVFFQNQRGTYYHIVNYFQKRSTTCIITVQQNTLEFASKKRCLFQNQAALLENRATNLLNEYPNILFCISANLIASQKYQIHFARLF